MITQIAAVTLDLLFSLCKYVCLVKLENWKQQMQVAGVDKALHSLTTLIHIVSSRIFLSFYLPLSYTHNNQYVSFPPWFSMKATYNIQKSAALCVAALRVKHNHTDLNL